MIVSHVKGIQVGDVEGIGNNGAVAGVRSGPSAADSGYDILGSIGYHDSAGYRGSAVGRQDIGDLDGKLGAVRGHVKRAQATVILRVVLSGTSEV